MQNALLDGLPARRQLEDVAGAVKRKFMILVKGHVKVLRRPDWQIRSSGLRCPQHERQQARRCSCLHGGIVFYFQPPREKVWMEGSFSGWSEEQGGQGAVPRLLPATEHRAWAGAHAPGALLPRASWTTGAWAPSSRGPGAGREGRTWSPCCRWDNSFSILQPAHVRSFKCRLTPWFLVRPSEPLTSVLL